MGKFGKNQQKIQRFLTKILRLESGAGLFWPGPFFPIFRLWIPKRCKGVHCVDLGESFPTSIYLQKSASIQPRTSLSKFGEKFNSLFIRLLTTNRRSTQRFVHLAAPRTPQLCVDPFSTLPTKSRASRQGSPPGADARRRALTGARRRGPPPQLSD